MDDAEIDIVECGHEETVDIVSFIVFGKGDYPSFELDGTHTDEHGDFMYYATQAGYIKVIGNIHENKELLK